VINNNGVARMHSPSSNANSHSHPNSNNSIVLEGIMEGVEEVGKGVGRLFSPSTTKKRLSALSSSSTSSSSTSSTSDCGPLTPPPKEVPPGCWDDEPVSVVDRITTATTSSTGQQLHRRKSREDKFPMSGHGSSLSSSLVQLPGSRSSSL